MFKFTEEQLMIRDMVREFTANEVEPRDRDMDENGFDFDLIPKLVDAGLMAIHLPNSTAVAAAIPSPVRSSSTRSQRAALRSPCSWTLTGWQPT